MPEPPLTADRLEELERLARQATWGERWVGGAGRVEYDRHYSPGTVFCEGPDGVRVLMQMNTNFDGEADGRFTAAADPATVLALLAEREAMAARIRELEDDLRIHREVSDELHGTRL